MLFFEQGDNCSTSMTFQFVMPAPARYYRVFLRRLMRLAGLKPCIAHWGQAIGLGILSLPTGWSFAWNAPSISARCVVVVVCHTVVFAGLTIGIDGAQGDCD